MSLMQWLAVGTTVNSTKDRRSPYKMAQQNLLPKFGSSQSPEPPPAPGVSLPQPSRPPTAKKAWWGRWMPVKRNKKMNVVEEIESSAQVPSTVATVTAVYPQGRWTLIKNPFH